MDASARITLSQVHTTLTEVKSLVETSVAEQRQQIGSLTDRTGKAEGRLNAHDERLRTVELAQATTAGVQALVVNADQARTNRTPAWVSIAVAASSLLLAAAIGAANLWKG
jgi:Tfp pilus assembly protein PilE